MISLRDSFCLQFPYRGNDMIFWIFPIVHCHAFCMWHWPRFGFGFHLRSPPSAFSLFSVFSGYEWSVDQLHDQSTCYTVLTRPNKVETAVHGCNSSLSVWTLSCHTVQSALHHCLLKVSSLLLRPWGWRVWSLSMRHASLALRTLSRLDLTSSRGISCMSVAFWLFRAPKGFRAPGLRPKKCRAPGLISEL